MNFTNMTQFDRVKKAFSKRSLDWGKVSVETNDNAEVREFLMGLQEAYNLTRNNSTGNFS
ncbi:hypothetical protein [Chitinivibrio alkaliphilus]|uniref:Uncharacterized protein n=1 Tax=Chitinivibrio alkaliphilus ACht1 TaxID=1313304 RepID=U7DBT2_9BACT|nr:hypothetical protein [Chitinivibrio alkaliphilus]ERP39043.1 hypothetical protein CALK_0537 [Chitinivibrio alkaliphilus ACht1]